jgi:hypothetical protein
VTDTVKSAVEERIEGGKPGRWKAFVAAVVIGFAAFLLAYRLLRSGGN